jgi:hypothetical protein
MIEFILALLAIPLTLLGVGLAAEILERIKKDK